jgi:hypothetical protein
MAERVRLAVTWPVPLSVIDVVWLRASVMPVTWFRWSSVYVVVLPRASCSHANPIHGI